jgi:hypothetical protein
MLFASVFIPDFPLQAELGIIALLDRSIERVHVDVDDFPPHHLETILLPG